MIVGFGYVVFEDLCGGLVIQYPLAQILCERYGNARDFDFLLAGAGALKTERGQPQWPEVKGFDDIRLLHPLEIQTQTFAMEQARADLNAVSLDAKAKYPVLHYRVQ